MNITDRFLKYVSFDTQSSTTSSSIPSTSKQLLLANYLVEELKGLGIENSYVDEFGIVYATIPGNCNEGDVVGFIAHMDTSPDASGKDIKPRMIHQYDGSDIIINEDKNMYLSSKEYPHLLNLVGHDLIVTDGNTLLGADDKAGIAIIMQMVEELSMHPEIKHNDIQIAFTPDEEVARGTENFDLKKFNAKYAYTIDGGDISVVEYENFNAFMAKVKVNGKSIHPGTAKNKMINSIHVGYEFNSLLPVHARPESTEGYEGFNHLHDISGNCQTTHMEYIIRNHDLDLAKKQCQDFLDIRDFMNKKYGYKIIEVELSQTYLNMKEMLKDDMYIVERARDAINSVGLTCKDEPIRGGTDGVLLTYMGLPTPNLGTGGFNYHGPYEHVSINMMEKQTQVLLYLVSHTK